MYVCVLCAFTTALFCSLLGSVRDQMAASLVKAIPTQAWTGLEISSRFRLPEFVDNQHMK